MGLYCFITLPIDGVKCLANGTGNTFWPILTIHACKFVNFSFSASKTAARIQYFDLFLTFLTWNNENKLGKSRKYRVRRAEMNCLKWVGNHWEECWQEMALQCSVDYIQKIDYVMSDLSGGRCRRRNPRQQLQSTRESRKRKLATGDVVRRQTETVQDDKWTERNRCERGTLCSTVPVE